MVVMVAIVNTVADLRPGMELDWQLFLVFALAALTVISLQVYALNLAAQVGERAVGRIRLRVADLVRRSELAGIEQIGPVRVYDTIARETTTIANSAGNIILSLTSAVALAFAAVYVAMLSLVAFLVIGILLSAWAYYYGLNQASGRAALIEAKTADARFFELLSHLLYGFKEVKLHSPRGDDLEKGYLARASDDAEHKNVLAARQFSHGLRAGYAVFYALLGSAVFVLPPYLEDVRMAVKIVYSVMFLFTTLDSITRIVPLLTRANLALDNVDALETSLVASAREQPAVASDVAAVFETLSLQNVKYTYPGPAGSTFTLGPCSLEVRPGRMIFIVGGNGSGKSTFARVLTRLYAPNWVRSCGTGRRSAMTMSRPIAACSLPSTPTSISSIGSMASPLPTRRVSQACCPISGSRTGSSSPTAPSARRRCRPASASGWPSSWRCSKTGRSTCSTS